MSDIKHLAKKIPLFDHCKFFKYISVNKETLCWEWLGALSRKGYGNMRVTTSEDSRAFYAHRLSLALFGKGLDRKLRVDHMCKNRKCVNPDHLREVSQLVNTLENSNNVGALNKSKTHCKYGHEFFGENLTLGKNGRRLCKKCIENYNIKRRTNSITSNPVGIPIGVNKTRFGTFMARIRVEGAEYCIGSFRSLEEAVDAHKEVFFCWFGEYPKRFKKGVL